MTENTIIPVATIRTSPRDEIRVTTAIDSKGRRTIKIRAWYLAEDGSYRPGKDGMQIRAGVIDRVMQALAKAKAD